MKKFLLLTLLALLIWGSAQLPAAISALAFGDYYFQLKNNNAAIEKQNGFWLRRIYLTYDSDLSDKLKARVRLEIQSPGNFPTATALLNPYLKDSYLSYQFLPLHKITLGIQGCLSFDNIDKWYGYRHVEKTMWDLYKVRSSREFGLTLSGSFDTTKKFNYSVQFGNNSGYKNEIDKYKEIGVDFTLNLTPQLIIEINGDRATVSATKTDSQYQAFAGYQGDWGRVGVNYGNEIIAETGKADVNFGVLSAFAVAKFSKQVEALARYDLTFDPQPNGQGDFLVIEKGYKTNLFILGLGWNIHPKLQIMPNIKLLSYQANAAGVTPKANQQFNITFNYQF
jgi:opacity protein-like surface antigen